MHETATLHFDLQHLSPDQTFTLHVGKRTYTLAPHTRHTIARARRTNAALAVLPDHRVSHFTDRVRLPAVGPVLLRVTAPRLRPSEPLDRLVLTAIRLPRRARLAAIRRRAASRPASWSKLAALGGPAMPPPDDIILDLEDIGTAFAAAESLVFHHPELLSLQDAPATAVQTLIQDSAGLYALAQSMLDQSQAHEADPTQPNWATSQPGTDWQTGADAGPIYAWSSQTVEYLVAPLQDALRRSKNDPDLQGQCWTVLPGVTQVVPAPPAGFASVAEALYTVKEVTPQNGVSNSFAYDPSTATATITLANSYLRWLTISVDQYGPDGEQIGSTSNIGQLSPVDTIMAVPLPAQPSPFTFTFNTLASSALISMGGLGQTPLTWTYDGIGILLTAIFNYAIPTLFIALGVAVDQGGSGWTDLTKQVVPVILTVLEAAAEGPVGSAIAGGVSLEDVLAAIANCDASLLLGILTSSEALTAYITAAISESAAEDAAPFVGWIARAIGSAADVASMIETSVEVARCPATMQLSVLRTMDVSITVNPDPAHEGQWPATATYYVITVIYDDGPTYPSNGEMNPTTQQGPILCTLTGLPAGGNITVLACFYSANDWLAGQGTTTSIPAQPNQGSTLVVPAFAIKENLVPLSATTTYTFKEKLGYANGARVWLPANSGAPTETVSNLDSSNVGNNLSQLGALTLNEPLSALGYLWTASGQNVPIINTGQQPYPGQITTLQAVSDGASPQSGLQFSGVGYIARPCLAFPPPTAVNPAADGFLLEPNLQSSEQTMYLRALSLQPEQPLLPAPGQSFGQFTGTPDDLAIHPAGYAVALSIATATLQILRIGALVADAAAPAAAIYAGQGTRPGLLYDPAAVACSLDKILVLQTAPQYPQGCIAAFDFKGNPVNCFSGGLSVMPLYAEGNAGVTPLDLSVESKGYIYVLKYLPPAAGLVLPSNYWLDIYMPDGTFLTQVQGLAAARLQVDLWRNLFTLNYEIIAGSGRTEPSASQWIPSTP